MKPPASLVEVKCKWYVQITVPPEHRERLKGKKQLRLSTGTSDKRTAERLKHDAAQKLYNQLPDELEDLMDELRGESSPDWFPADGDDKGRSTISPKTNICRNMTPRGMT
ncbi:MAG: DUF6538 domain-containing protein [Albidovulum sp.]